MILIKLKPRLVRTTEQTGVGMNPGQTGVAAIVQDGGGYICLPIKTGPAYLFKLKGYRDSPSTTIFGDDPLTGVGTNPGQVYFFVFALTGVDRGWYEPRTNWGWYEPRTNRGWYEPRTNRGWYKPRTNRGWYEPWTTAIVQDGGGYTRLPIKTRPAYLFKLIGYPDSPSASIFGDDPLRKYGTRSMEKSMDFKILIPGKKGDLALATRLGTDSSGHGIGVIWYAYFPEPSTAKMGRKLKSSTSATLAGMWERESISLIKPALNHERKQMRASTVSELRLILAIPKQSFPVLNALSLPALVAGMLNISLAMFDNLGHLLDLWSQ
ncbi:hypothetical protein OUZ56_012847 [Daphnia magna]|uniref:Uncharacterized protein n=1 Tax=Daphnia magna TaxID=35525 RepID=A0ABQ9Z475_9CRUS|nr:hypothetical protein OUZ56_012847 [Daphnia magna]